MDPGPAPLPRTPAGAWLPPSAVLDGLDAAPGRPETCNGRLTARTHPRSLPKFGEALAIPAGGPRRVIVAGAAVASIGFFLPWANVLAGAGLIGGYFTQWGLAGPGHWIMLTALAVLAIAAGSGTRTAGWPVGLAGVVAASVLLGLTWPYLFGVLGRSVGVWVVVIGAVVLLLGAALDRLDRHAAEPPAVP